MTLENVQAALDGTCETGGACACTALMLRSQTSSLILSEKSLVEPSYSQHRLVSL